MSLCLLSETMIGREVTRILWDQLDSDAIPEVKAALALELMSGDARLGLEWSGQRYERVIPYEALKLSLDDFCQRYLLLAASELCGRPLLDNGRIVINPVHDEVEAS